MSFRNPFVTDFIYQASEETKDANPKLEEIFREYASVLDHTVDERGYGYYAGIIRSTTFGPEDLQIDEMVIKLEKATKVPFRLTIMIESGPAIGYTITPRT